MNERETKLLKTIDMSGLGFRAWVAFLVSVLLWGVFAYSRQLRFGLIETGMRDQISWGLYISNFVFFIGISHAGTLISAILRVTDAGWRTPITRMAEGITVVALCIGGSMVLVDLGRPDRALNLFRYGRIQSPIVWDVLSVGTYLTGCILYFYLPLIPDLGIVAARPDIGGFRRGLYRALSLGWIGSPKQWRLLEKAISIMAVAIIPLAISVHTVVSWIFAMTLRPGWDSSIFGPYFVVGAIYSGAAAVVLAMCLLRRIFHLEDYLKPVHFRNLGLLLLSFSMLYLYFNVNEYLTLGYKVRGPEKVLLDRLFYGDYAPYFWVVAFVGVLLPMVLMMLVLGPKRYRDFTVPGLGVASFMAIIGAWAKRYLIVVPTLSSPFLPIQGVPKEWSHYAPSWVEWSITAAAFAAFLLLYTLLAKTFPVVSIWETRETGEPAELAPARRSHTVRNELGAGGPDHRAAGLRITVERAGCTGARRCEGREGPATDHHLDGLAGAEAGGRAARGRRQDRSSRRRNPALLSRYQAAVLPLGCGKRQQAQGIADPRDCRLGAVEGCQRPAAGLPGGQLRTEDLARPAGVRRAGHRR
ncbi:Polysulfide reductase (modular protein) [Candidatus Sulfopaludibacter sp. SbA4]|nr:Polysulfide reductase (modular protein) [Candidatus Sulfopaludibacter sp. SbA4]